MNQKTIERIAKNPSEQWYYKLAEIAKILGRDRDKVSSFLKEKSVPYYCVGRSKMYLLPEVLEAVEGTKWQDGSN